MTTKTLRIKSGTHNVIAAKPRPYAMAELQRRYREYLDALNVAQQSAMVQPLTLKQAASHGERVEAIINGIEKRGNVLLTMAMREAGMEGYIGKWTLAIDRHPMRLLSDASIGKVRFVLIHDAKNKWKGNILKCPLLSIMRMEFPTQWLVMSTEQVKRQMRQRLE